jgi:hypothetical protein
MDADELDEIISVTETPGDGVRFEFRSGRNRTLLGLSIEDARREVGRVGDRCPNGNTNECKIIPSSRPR